MDNRQLLKNFLREISGLPLLKEQDDPFAGEEEDEEEEGGEEAEDDTAEEDEESEEKEEKPEDDAKEDIDPKAGLDDSLDGELSAIFIDIESKSMEEGYQDPYSLAYHMLQEQSESSSLNIDKFAEETARIFTNTSAFLDIEEIILKKAKQFVADNHGEDKAAQLLNILKNRYNIVGKEEKKTADIDAAASVPIAVGASGGASA